MCFACFATEDFVGVEVSIVDEAHSLDGPPRCLLKTQVGGRGVRSEELVRDGVRCQAA